MTPAALLAVGVVAAGLLGAGLWTGPRVDGPMLLINETPSAPRGLYLRIRASLSRGDRVAIGQPAVARAYLADLGVPPGLPLLKEVRAVDGDRVCAARGWLTWPGGRARALARDRRGRALTPWSGCRALAPGEVLLIGDTPTSFDSRYFGPAPAGSVLGVYRQVLTW